MWIKLWVPVTPESQPRCPQAHPPTTAHRFTLRGDSTAGTNAPRPQVWPEKLFAGDVGAPVGLGGTPRLESVEVRMPSWELAPGSEAGCHSRRTERILTFCRLD